MAIRRVESTATYTQHWGYSRVVRIGQRLLVSGTSATNPDGSVHAPGDPHAQTVYILALIDAALREAGATLSDVVLTRAFITTPEIWREVGRAHMEHFGSILPVSSCIAGAELMQPGLVVEIEAEAFVAD